MPVPALPPSDIDMTKYATDIDEARAKQTPMLLASSDKAGNVDIGVKGSIFVFDKDHVAYLERTLGTHLKNVKENPHVALYYANKDAAVPMLRIFGQATVYESGDIREEIRNRVIEPERNADADNKGAGILVRVDKLAGRGVNLSR